MNKLVKILFAVFVFFSCTIQAQNAILSGRVLDNEGSPIPEVQVAVFGSGSQSVFTDSTGKYSLSIPSGNELTIVFNNLSYESVKHTITPKPGEKITINPRLKFKNDLNEVKVIDENRKQDVVYIQPKDYFKLAGPNPDISKLLLAQGLGVQSSNELSSAYSVRGGNYDENLVYVNDVEIFRPQLARSGQQEGLSFANPDMVSGINFSSGGFEAKYGDKLSSVLDITYKKPREFSSTVSGGLLGGSVHMQNVSKNKLFSWQVGGRYRSTQYLLKTLDTKGEYKPTFYDIQSLLNFAITEKFSVEVLANVTGNKYLVKPSDRETTFGTFNQALRFKVYFDGQEISKYNTYFGALTATYKPKKDLMLKFITSAYKDFEDETFTVQGQYYIDELNTDFGSSGFGNVAFNRGVGTYINHGRNYLDATILNAEHKGKYEISKEQQVLWGARVQEEIISDKLSEWNYLDSAGYSIPNNNPNSVELPYVLKTKNNIQSARLMGYGEYIFNRQLKDTSVVTLTAGLRSNYWTFNTQNVISPRVTLAYDPNWKRDWVFRASYGYYYQPPFYRDMRGLNGKIDSSIKAQQSIHYVLSSDLNFKIWNRRFKFMNAIYYKDMKNLIPYDVDNVRIRYYAKNNSSGYATGLDMRLNGEFIKGTESWISMSIMQTREKINGLGVWNYTDVNGQPWYPGTSVTQVKDSVYNMKGYIPRPTDQLVTFNMFFQDYLPKLPRCKMYLSLIYGSGLPVTIVGKKQLMSDKFRFPSYKRVDIGFTYDIVKEDKPKGWVKGAWISLEVWNLLGINNTVSYIWIKDVTNTQYAIPNYLTNRQVNIKLQVKF
ncbi:MAG: TonB-dependent receptor [Bacteroidia bacterium]